MTRKERTRRKIIELLVDGTRRGEELIRRVLGLPLPNAIVQVRHLGDEDAPGTENRLRVDGKTVYPRDGRRVSTLELNDALKEE